MARLHQIRLANLQPRSFTRSDGADPLASKRAARVGTSVAELCDWYLSAAQRGLILGRTNKPIKRSTLAMDRSRIERHVKPAIGRRSIAGLMPADFKDLQAAIAAGKTAFPRRDGRGGLTTGGTGVASRTISMLKAIFAHAAAMGLVESNPTAGVKRLAGNRSHRRLSHSELMALGKALDAAALSKEVPAAAIRFLLQTGFRRMEALALQIDDLDEIPNSQSRRYKKWSAEAVDRLGCNRYVEKCTATPGSSAGHFRPPRAESIMWAFRRLFWC